MLLDAGKPLPPWKSFNVVPYDLRHSFAAWCRDNGVEINTVVGWMGHADATMILKIYDEVSDSRSKSEAEKLIKSAFGSQNGSQNETDHPPARTE
jgi:integrase